MSTIARATLALMLVSMTACLKDKTSSGASSTGVGAATPQVWVDQSAVGIAAAGEAPGTLLWIDATTVTSTGVGSIVPSTDEITYNFPVIFIPPGTNHPLQTNSTANAVVSPEDQLSQAINTYRQTSLGGGGLGGGGLPGLGGGGGGAAVTTVMLPMSGRLRKNARAHCKDRGLYHMGPLVAANGEGDTVVGGVGTPAGRLPKCNVTVGLTAVAFVSGLGYPSAVAARDYFVQNNSAILLGTGYTHIGVGHWPNGDDDYYWSLIFAQGVNPLN